MIIIRIKLLIMRRNTHTRTRRERLPRTREGTGTNREYLRNEHVWSATNQEHSSNTDKRHYIIAEQTRTEQGTNREKPPIWFKTKRERLKKRTKRENHATN